MVRRLIRLAIVVWLVRQALRWARNNGLSLGSLEGSPFGDRAPATRHPARAPWAGDGGSGPARSQAAPASGDTSSRGEFDDWGTGPDGRGSLADAAPGSPERAAALRKAAEEARARLEATTRREAAAAEAATAEAASAASEGTGAAEDAAAPAPDDGPTSDATTASEDAASEDAASEDAASEDAASDPTQAGPTTSTSAVDASPTVGDDLKIVEGIGPRIDGVLRAAGVTTFQQLADMSPGRIETIIRQAGVRKTRPTTWPEQARLAAKGEWDALAEMQAHLRGGRKIS